MAIEFRQAEKKDAEAIAALHTQSWQKYYGNDLKSDYLRYIAPSERQQDWAKRLTSPSPKQHIIVAADASKLVGFICLYLDENAEWGSYINNLHVNSDYQGQGLGKHLLTQGLRYCHEHADSQAAYLLVNQSNVKAQTFYLNQGAENIKAAEWHAPEGSIVPTYWFAWRNLNTLKNHAQ